MRPSFKAFSEELQKYASPDDKKKSPGMDMAKILGAGTLGFGVGTGVGALGGWLADKAVQGATGKGIPKKYIMVGAPLLGTGAGIAYAIHKAREQEALRRVLEDSADSRRG